MKKILITGISGFVRGHIVHFLAEPFRPTEVDELIADASKAAKVLKWRPKVKFCDLVKIMLDADLRAAGLEAPGEGNAIIKKKFPKNGGKGIDEAR